MSRMTIVTCVLFSFAVVFVLCVSSFCVSCHGFLVTREFFLVVSGEVVKAMASKKVWTQGDFCAVL